MYDVENLFDQQITTRNVPVVQVPQQMHPGQGLAVSQGSP